MMRYHCLNIFYLWLATFLVACTAVNAQEGKKADWRSDWELAENLTIEIDTEGYSLPVQVVFVPNPGSEPKDPLYYVVELKGTIKVITNDRTVRIFAKDFLPNPQGEAFVPTGAAGLCLDPSSGYVFATFAYLDDTSIYRNGMARFSTKSGGLGLKAEKTDIFLDLFKGEVAGGGHTIGPCQIKDDLLYVTVGYGEDVSSSQNLHAVNGSILRMTLDFKPVTDNPFYEDNGMDTAIDYIWAYGFRNPFGLLFVGDRLFATENGGDVDRFNEIFEGENYLSEGNDWSIGARAVQLFAPSVGIVHLEFIPEESPLFPKEFAGHFVAAAAGAPGGVGPSRDGRRSILFWKYNFENKSIAKVPQHLLRYRGKGQQLPVSVALGPDALYFTALLPNSAGISPVYKIRFDASANYPFQIGSLRSAEMLINDFGCRQCHFIDGTGGKVGPPLESELLARLTTQLNQQDYEGRVAKVDKIKSQLYSNFSEARKEVVASTGLERVRRWLPYYLQEPKFDNPNVKMPSVGLSASDAQTIAKYLLRTKSNPSEEFGQLDHLRFAVARLLPDLRYRHLVTSFLLGGVITALLLLILFRRFSWRKPRS